MNAKKAFLALICMTCWFFGMSQNLTSSNLPILIINTNGQSIPNDPKISADLGIIYNGENSRNNITDPWNHYNGKIGIEVRGQSSQMFPMKSYSIELQTSTGASIDKSLFGLPKESDWVLYAPYTDKTLMRNFLAYTFSREMGHWSANCRYVEVILNGQYIGIYVFMEKIKRNSNRVNIPKMAVTDISGDALTGGYIFSIDKEANAWYSNYTVGGKETRFSYVYPKIADIVPEQMIYIRNYVDSFETALYQISNPSKPNEWRKFADESSFIDYFIVNEISRNVDGYRLSSYFYKDRNSKNKKIIAGPVWDYDLAFRNANYCNGSDTAGWAYQFNLDCPQDFWVPPFWWDNFMMDAGFKANLRCRWKELRQTSLSLDRINSLIDSIYNRTEEARQRHFVKWPTLGQYVWPNPQPIATNYSAEIFYLKAWIEARVGWLDRHMPNDGVCSDFPTGIKESILIKGNPNPVLNSFTLSIKSKIKQQLQIKAIDITGRTVYIKNYQANAGSNLLQVDMNQWQKGIYLFHFIATSGEKMVLKVMKQ